VQGSEKAEINGAADEEDEVETTAPTPITAAQPASRQAPSPDAERGGRGSLRDLSALRALLGDDGKAEEK
jgi:hypothetical protein